MLERKYTSTRSIFGNRCTSSCYRHLSGKRVWMRKHFLPNHVKIKWLDLNTIVCNKLMLVVGSTWYYKMEQGVTILWLWMVQWSRGMTTSCLRTTGSQKSPSTILALSKVSDSIWVMDLSGALVGFIVVRLWLLTLQTTKWLLDSKPSHTLTVKLTM